MKLNFEVSQIVKWTPETIRAWKMHEKNGIVCLFLMFRSRDMVLKLLKNGSFLQTLCWCQQKSVHFSIDWYGASERSQRVLSENGMVSTLWSYGSRDNAN